MKIYINNLRQNAEIRKIPIISIQTQEFLKEQLLHYKPKYFLEIGSAIGYSTIFVASLMKEWSGQVISFEVSYSAYLEALIHIKETGLGNITLYPFDITTSDVRKFVPKEIDFFFIDGQKNQYGKYLEKIEDIKAKRNLIILDDVIKYNSKMTQLYEYIDQKQINYQILPMEDGDGIMLINSI